MREIKRWIIDKDNHKDCNTFFLTIICHGTKQGHLLDKYNSKGWDTEDFVADLSVVKTLLGKPKTVIIQSCRGGLKLYYLILSTIELSFFKRTLTSLLKYQNSVALSYNFLFRAMDHRSARSRWYTSRWWGSGCSSYCGWQSRSLPGLCYSTWIHVSRFSLAKLPRKYPIGIM